jgi:antitoxin component YwqK of YwqJK toxin-antitoxin module
MSEKKQIGPMANSLNGVCDAYDPHAKTHKQAKFENGIMHGPYREFFDGVKTSIKVEGYYENGVKHGVWTEYDKKGRVEAVKIWNKGELLERTMYDDEDENEID